MKILKEKLLKFNLKKNNAYYLIYKLKFEISSKRISSI